MLRPSTSSLSTPHAARPFGLLHLKHQPLWPPRPRPGARSRAPPRAAPRRTAWHPTTSDGRGHPTAQRAPAAARAAAPSGAPGPDAAAAAASADAAPAAVQSVLLSRRRVGGLAVAALLLPIFDSLPLPAPATVLGVGLGPGPSACAATTEEEEQAEARREPASPGVQSPGEVVFGYVAPEPLGAVGPAGAAATGPPAARHFRTLAAAVAECPRGGVVLVAAGRYRERLLLSRPVTLRAWPKGAAVEVAWETTEPYQSTLEINAPAEAEAEAGAEAGAQATGGQVVVEGLTVRHSSKSVANNYGVFVRGGAPRLLDCDISSATGAGVGIEGASPQLVGCRVHGCARQGIAIFGATSLDLDLDLAVDPGLMYSMTGGVVRDCDVYGNALDGILVRSGASPDLLANLIHNNGGVGVNLQDCSGRYERNTVYDNARGAVAVSALFELDPGDLAGSNSLRGLLRKL